MGNSCGLVAMVGWMAISKKNVSISHFFSIQFKFFPLHEDQSALNYLSAQIPMLFYMLFYSILHDSHNRSDFASISRHLDSMW